MLTTDEIQEWIEITWAKHQVNLWAFAYQWADYFFDNEDIWPSTHIKRCLEGFRRYDYDYKKKSNLFNIDSLYRKMPKKPHTKDRKQEFEVLIMYCWLRYFEGEDGEWQEYLEKVTPFLEQKKQEV